MCAKYKQNKSTDVTQYEGGTDRSAHATMFGFDFQVNAAIVLMLENIREMTHLRLESKNEDIDLTLNDGSHILAQAKSIERSSEDFSNVLGNLKHSLMTLSEGANRVNANKLILITNSPAPLGKRASGSVFYGHSHRYYSDLPKIARDKIRTTLSKLPPSVPKLDLEKFVIHVIPFETDDELERYKVVKQVMNDFIGSLHLSVTISTTELHTIWNSSIFKNGTKKCDCIKLSKSEIIWPLIVVITNVNSINEKDYEELIGDVDREVYDEVIERYTDVINACCDKFEFVTKVISDYSTFNIKCSAKERHRLFIKDNWSSFKSEFEVISDEETKCALIKVILFNVLRNRLKIDTIKQKVGL